MRTLTEKSFDLGLIRLDPDDEKRLRSFIHRKLIGRFVLSENTDGPNEWLLSKLIGDKDWENWPSEGVRIPKNADIEDLLENRAIVIAIWKNPQEDIQVVERVFFGNTIWWVLTRKKTIATKSEEIIREEKRKFRVNYPLAFNKISSILNKYGLVGIVDGHQLYGCPDYYSFHCPIVIDLYLPRNIKIEVNTLNSLDIPEKQIESLAIQIFDILEEYGVLRWPCYLHSSNPEIYLVRQKDVIYTTWILPEHYELLKKLPPI